MPLLDRETIPEYELTEVAADKGRPSMKSAVKFKITLEDVVTVNQNLKRIRT